MSSIVSGPRTPRHGHQAILWIFHSNLSTLSGGRIPTGVSNSRKIRQADRAMCHLDFQIAQSIGFKGEFGRTCCELEIDCFSCPHSLGLRVDAAGSNVPCDAERRPLRRQPSDHNFSSLLMLAVTAGAFLLVTWVATMSGYLELGNVRCCGEVLEEIAPRTRTATKSWDPTLTSKWQPTNRIWPQRLPATR